MKHDPEMLVLVVASAISVLVLLAALVYMLVLHWRTVTLARKHEETLISIIKAKSLSEYAHVKKELSSTPKDRRRELELENELAREAHDLQQRQALGTRPV